MADKMCPGPVCGGNAGTGGIREAVSVHTNKVYDSCKSKECLRDLRVYLCQDAQELLNSGGVVSVKPRAADLLGVKIDVERVQFNRGFYSVDIRFYYKIECEIDCPVGPPRIIYGLSVFDKRVILFGSEGTARIFSSRFVADGADVQLRRKTNLPIAVVEVVEPILLSAKIVAPDTHCNCCCCDLSEVPPTLASCFGGSNLSLCNDCYKLFVSLGQFSIIRLERDIQLLMPAYDVCLPKRDCSGSDDGDEQDPCAVFSKFAFPIDEFFPPKMARSNCSAGQGDCGCGCKS